MGAGDRRRAEDIFPTLKVEDYAEIGRNRLIAEFGISARQAQKLRNMVKAALGTPSPAARPAVDAVPGEGPPADADSVTHEDGHYHFQWRDHTGPRRLTLTEAQVKSLILAYTSDGDDQSMQVVATRHGLLRTDFWKIKSLLGLTKQHEPFTPAELADRPLDELVADHVALKRRKLAKRVEADDYRQTQALARKWMEFKTGLLDPFEAVLHRVVGGLPGAAPLAMPAPRGATMLFMQVSDLHLGLKAPGYDVPTAAARFQQAITSQLSDAIELRGGIDLAVLGVGGDVMHVDNTHGATTSMRHHQDMDTTPEQMIQTIVELYIWAVELLLRTSAVDTVRIEVIPGNHDSMMSVAFGAALWARYKDHPRVVFGNMTSTHARWVWGACAFDGHHGHGDRNTASLGAGISAWLRKEGLAAKFYYAITGNLHHVMAKEDGGCLQLQQSSPSEPDRFTDKGNYATNPPSSQAFVFDSTEGWKATLSVNWV